MRLRGTRGCIIARRAGGLPLPSPGQSGGSLARSAISHVGYDRFVVPLPALFRLRTTPRPGTRLLCGVRCPLRFRSRFISCAFGAVPSAPSSGADSWSAGLRRSLCSILSSRPSLAGPTPMCTASSFTAPRSPVPRTRQARAGGTAACAPGRVLLAAQRALHLRVSSRGLVVPCDPARAGPGPPSPNAALPSASRAPGPRRSMGADAHCRPGADRTDTASLRPTYP